MNAFSKMWQSTSAQGVGVMHGTSIGGRLWRWSWGGLVLCLLLVSCKSRTVIDSGLSDNYNNIDRDPQVQELLARMDPPFELGNTVYLPPDASYYYQNREFIEGEIGAKHWPAYKFIDPRAGKKHDYIVGLMFSYQSTAGSRQNTPVLYYKVLAEEAPDLSRNLLALLAAGYFNGQEFSLYQAAVPFLGSKDAEDLYALRAQNIVIRDYLTPGRGLNQGDLLVAVQSFGDAMSGTSLATKLFFNSLTKISDWPLFHPPARVAQLLGVESNTGGNKSTYSLPQALPVVRDLITAMMASRSVRLESHVVRVNSEPFRVGYGRPLDSIDGQSGSNKQIYKCDAPTRTVDSRNRLLFWGDACPKQVVCMNQRVLVPCGAGSQIGWECAKDGALFDCCGGGVSATSDKIPSSCSNIESAAAIAKRKRDAAKAGCDTPTRVVPTKERLEYHRQRCPQQVICLNRGGLVPCGEGGSQIGWDCAHAGQIYQCCGGGVSATADQVPEACLRKHDPWSGLYPQKD